MKIIKTSLLLLLTVIVVTSCSSDDDSGPAPVENQPPGNFDLLIVPDQATNVDVEPGLSWSESTDPDGDEVSYSLFLGTDQGNLTELVSGLTGTSHQVEERLNLKVEYYWKVVATDGNGGETESSTHSFTTRKLNDAQQTTASAGFSASTEIHTVVFDGKLWAIGGNVGNTIYDEVWNTTDGSTWNQAGNASFGPVYYHQTLVYDGKMWVLCGHDGTKVINGVYSSTDGLTWSGNQTAPFRYDHTALVFDGKMWIIGGTNGNNSSFYKNDVWYSTDGIQWVKATGSAAFSPRRGHTSLVYDGKMWVIGGYDGSSLNDVWSSTDGITWTQATASADFPARYQHVSEVYGGKMWVISGDVSGTTDETNDVWSSTDGENWTEVHTTAAFTPRRYAASAVFDEKLWVIGGYDNVTGYVDDVWYMD